MAEDITVDGAGSITADGVFVYPRDGDITKSETDLKAFITTHHDSLQPGYKTARDYYTGQHPVLTDTTLGDKDGLGKPDNRLVVNYPRYIVDTFNGFFIGIQPKISLDGDADDEKLQDFHKANSFYDKLYQASKQSSIEGRAYLYAYQNEDRETRVAVLKAEDAFMVYDNTVAQTPLAFVMYGYDDEDKLSGTLCTASGIYDIDNDCHLGPAQANIFKAVPAVEIIENEERQGTFENVETLVDAVNRALSQKANDVDYFADAYMKIIGAQLDEETLKNIRNNHIINLAGTGSDAITIDFMEKPNADGEQEHLIDRLNNLIFQISMVANITDETFGNASSGKSLEYKLLSMRNLAANKERKLTQALRHFYGIIFGAGTLGIGNADEAIKSLTFQFTRNMPSNLVDEAATAKSLEGIVSKETVLKTLSIVDDPKAEMERIADEQKDEQTRAANGGGQYDFEKKDDQTEGDVDGDDEEE